MTTSTADFKILLDVPVEATPELALGYAELATAFRDVIEKSDPRFSIGVFGGWGSGKTTLMRAIDRLLDTKQCASVWFSAWRYEKEQHLIVPLLDVVREGLVAWVDANQTQPEAIRATVKRVAATVGKAIGSLLAGFSVKAGVPGGPEISYEINKAITRAEKYDDQDAAARVPRSFYHASFLALRDAFLEFTGKDGKERRIVVFVDDLDRCLPEGALEVLESMKLFFDLPGFVFVVGLDRAVVEMSVEKRYRELVPVADGAGGTPRRPEVLSGAQYLRKIFQVPYGLAPVSTRQITEFLSSVQRNADLPAEQWKEVEDHVAPHLRFLVDASGVNPREIKRYINAYTLVRKIRPGLDQDVVLTLQTLAFRADWQPIQFAVLAFREAFVDALKRHVAEPDAGHLEALTPELTTLPQSFMTYVAPGQPGAALVERPFLIEEYIYSGEATRGNESSIFMDVFRDLGGLVHAIHDVARTGTGEQQVAQTAQSAVSMLKTAAPNASKAVDPEIRALAGLLDSAEFKAALVSVKDPSLAGENRGVLQEQLLRLETKAISHVRDAMRILWETYQAGAL